MVTREITPAVKRLIRECENLDRENARLKDRIAELEEAGAERKTDLEDFVGVLRAVGRELAERSAALEAATARLEALGGGDPREFERTTIARADVILWAVKASQGRYSQSAEAADALADLCEWVAEAFS
jgi:hypothetical protein